MSRRLHRHFARHFARLPLCGILAWTLCIAPTLRAQERVDVATIDRITSEAMRRSQVMDIMSWLSDVYGPRLTWSPNTARAGAWAAAQMQSWGLQNVHEERWDSPAGLGIARPPRTPQNRRPQPSRLPRNIAYSHSLKRRSLDP